MQFIKNEDLKAGIRLARPIFDKNGTLLYDRGSALTSGNIPSIRKFGFPGLFVLEPAEPIPPITQEELEYERFQSIVLHRISEDFHSLHNAHAPENMDTLTTQIMNLYGNFSHRMIFVQDLRSEEDALYKHSLNVAILCARLANEMKLDVMSKYSVIYAALLHDIGLDSDIARHRKRLIDFSNDIPEIFTPEMEYYFKIDYEDRNSGYEILHAEYNDYELPDKALNIMHQFNHVFFHPQMPLNERLAEFWEPETHILHVANMFDVLTCMNSFHEPLSFMRAIRYLKKHKDFYDSNVVNALCRSLSILPAGACVDLNNGDKGVVLAENIEDFEFPVIFSFNSKKLIDLSQSDSQNEHWIIDNMRMMDNRPKMDAETLKHFIADPGLINTTRMIQKKLLASHERLAKQGIVI
ncbi:HD-GYP domain-containing protein [Eubacterium oxidoreducens]|uniref:HD domain-containing protein n=1 Tax=Eubacterium oxidoreducens TaxID=1732 RepID=A0A1G6BBZ3_EUBOX|nr:HD domain-containing protein [Eubacterium oxidoreducens]SDB18059.1 HD domain-containing protein [Eubacterium oxidoreducens]